MADWAEDVAEEIVNSPRGECPDLDSGAWAIDREWLEAAVAQALHAARAGGIEAAAKVADEAWCSHIAKPIRALLTKESDDA